MNKKELLERLKQLDSDMALLDNSEDYYTCVIVGGSALVLMDKIYRSTHDIDSIASRLHPARKSCLYWMRMEST